MDYPAPLVRFVDTHAADLDHLYFDVGLDYEPHGGGVRFLEMYYGETNLGVTGAATVVARLTASALVRGDKARRAFAPFRARIRVDGDEVETRPYTIMGGSSVRHIGLGSRRSGVRVATRSASTSPPPTPARSGS